MNKTGRIVDKLSATDLLDWYDRNARELPWRVAPALRKAGKRPDPYHVWLSEVMLQQTTIPHATRYFLRFTELWPTIGALASAPGEDIMREWAGLGYYARARNLHKCAKAVAELGAFPETYEALIKLPGVGPYTAGAISAIAFDQPNAAVDGNVDRVLARALALKSDWKTAKQTVREATQKLVPEGRPGDFAQALMDLGATVCTPRKPNCALCPWQTTCVGYREGSPEIYPIKPAKTAKPMRYGVCYIYEQGGEVCLVRRPESGLLGGMLALPSTEWTADGAIVERAHPELDVPDMKTIGEVRHVFTHFSLKLQVRHADGRAIGNSANQTGEWVPVTKLNAAGLPSVFTKAVSLLRS